jgi:hypothetical protein
VYAEAKPPRARSQDAMRKTAAGAQGAERSQAPSGSRRAPPRRLGSGPGFSLAAEAVRSSRRRWSRESCRRRGASPGSCRRSWSARSAFGTGPAPRASATPDAPPSPASRSSSRSRGPACRGPGGNPSGWRERGRGRSPARRRGGGGGPPPTGFRSAGRLSGSPVRPGRRHRILHVLGNALGL